MPYKPGFSGLPSFGSRRIQVLSAVPEGARRAPGQAAWVRAVQAHPATAALRADAHDHLMAVVWVLARHACWTHLTTRPTWARVCALTGLSRATVARWIAWLRRAGLLGVVEPGSTPRFRGRLDTDGGNRAAEYVLTIPAVADAGGRVGGSETPTPEPPKEGSNRPARARTRREPPPTARNGQGTWWPMHVTPGSKREALQAAGALRGVSLELRRLSARHVRSLVRPLFAAGWTPADVLYAIDHRPDGTPWPYAGTARHVPGWVRFRLAPWWVGDRPALSRSQMLAAAAERVRAEQRERAAERARLEARRAADPARHAAAARALLAAASRSAARVIAARRGAA